MSVCASLSVRPSVWESCNLLWLFILRKVYIVTGMLLLCQVCHGMLQRGYGTLWEPSSLCELLFSRQFLSLFILGWNEDYSAWLPVVSVSVRERMRKRRTSSCWAGDNKHYSTSEGKQSRQSHTCLCPQLKLIFCPPWEGQCGCWVRSRNSHTFFYFGGPFCFL